MLVQNSSVGGVWVNTVTFARANGLYYRVLMAKGWQNLLAEKMVIFTGWDMGWQKLLKYFLRWDHLVPALGWFKFCVLWTRSECARGHKRALKISKLSSGIGLRMGGATPYPLPHPYHGLVLPKSSVAKISKQELFALQDLLSIKCAELINCHYSGLGLSDRCPQNSRPRNWTTEWADSICGQWHACHQGQKRWTRWLLGKKLYQYLAA